MFLLIVIGNPNFVLRKQQKLNAVTEGSEERTTKNTARHICIDFLEHSLQFHYKMSQVDQKRAFNKLKHDLEPWRNLIVHMDALLTWEKNFYPAVIGGGISVLFLILWALDLSLVTLFALGCLIAIAFDFVYPSVSRFLFNPDNWNGEQEEKFERVCNQVCSIKTNARAWYEYVFTAKERKSTMFAIITTVILLVLAWIGAIINNLLLMYLIILGVAMYPGMHEKNVFNMLKEKFGGVVNSKIQNLREKTKKSE